MATGPIDLRALKAAHTRFLLEHDKMLSQEAERAGQFGEEHVHLYPEFHPRTRELQRATQHRVIRTKSGRVIRLQNAKKYAGAIDQGARPHVIRPRRAKFLRFMAGGHVVFARKVNHPGNRPYKFLYRATQAAYRTFSTSMLWRAAQLASRF